MLNYYKTDNRQLTFRECWNLTRNPLVLVMWFTKIFGIKLKLASGLTFPDSILDWEVDEEELLPIVRKPLADHVSTLSQLGFHSPFYYTMKDFLYPADFGAVAMLHESGDLIATVLHVRDRTVHPPKSQTVISMVTLRQDGTYLATTNRRTELHGPPTTEGKRLVGAPPERLLHSHLQSLADTRDMDPVRRLNSADEMIATVGMLERQDFEFHIERGFYVPMSEAEVAVARAKYGKKPTASPPPSTAIANLAAREELDVDEDQIFWDDDDDDTGENEVDGDELPTADVSEHDEVLAELTELQQGKSNWITMIVMLAVSLALFMGAGAAAWSWKFAALLIPILLFHEMGHFVAMRVFKYRNVKMFFIPLLGAAVSGQNFNVPGWKKTVVSLMGPVPGILVGSGMGIAGLVTGHEMLMKFSLLTLALNGFNLLPIIPLDGGWVMHSLVFCRHFILDGAFRLLAIMLLGGVGLLLGEKFLLFIAFANLFGLVGIFRLAKITDRLKQRGISPASRDSKTIPLETAHAIIGEIKQSFPSGIANKAIAQHTLHVFESLNARPPGILATTFLLGVYGGSFLMAVVMAAAIVVGMGGQGQFGKVMEMAVNQPLQAVECGTIQQKTGLEYDETLKQYNTIIATFEDQETATSSYDRLAADLPQRGAVTLLGQTVLLELPPDDDESRQKWYEELEQITEIIFVDSEELASSFRLTCFAPSVKIAEALEKKATEYFELPQQMSLIPPWSPDDNRDEKTRTEHLLARQTYQQLQVESYGIYDDPRIEEFGNKMDQARRSADHAELEKLQKEQQQLLADARKAIYQKHREENSKNMDSQIVDLHEKMSGFNLMEENDESAYNDILTEMGARMGQLPLEEGEASPHNLRFSARGSVDRAGLVLEFSWLQFQRKSTGPTEFIRWLCDQGCVDMKYGYESFGNFDDDF